MIFNFGSINIDHVYRVPHLPEPGETLTASSRETHLGGKGINQSIAISRAGGNVIHIGAVGPDGDWALQEVRDLGVGTDAISKVDAPTGHAVIYVDDDAENEIVILAGANACLTENQIRETMEHASSDDWVLVQNETNLVPQVVAAAKHAGCKVAYSAAPFVADVAISLLEKIDLLVVNEGEANALSDALGVEVHRIPVSEVLITKGSKGASFKHSQGILEQDAFKVTPVDTTGAGDTFLGSFLARLDLGNEACEALEYAAAASALQVTQVGAATAIPDQAGVLEFLKSQEK